MQTIKNDFLSVTISELGAELQSIKSNSGKEYLWQGLPEIWDGRSPVLFPIVGRMKDDKIIVKGKAYPMDKHGFARKMNFEVSALSENEVTFFIKSNEETRKSFPWDFEFYMNYKLVNNMLTITYDIKNTSDETMTFSFGAHPGFSCKMGDILEFEKNETIFSHVMNNDAYLYKKIPYLNNENKIIITEDIFNDDALMFEDMESQVITLKPQNEDYSITVNYYDAQFLGIWAKPGAPYVCIEPWFGINDFIESEEEFDKKYGVLSLDANDTFEYKIDITVN